MEYPSVDEFPRVQKSGISQNASYSEDDDSSIKLLFVFLDLFGLKTSLAGIESVVPGDE